MHILIKIGVRHCFINTQVVDCRDIHIMIKLGVRHCFINTQAVDCRDIPILIKLGVKNCFINTQVVEIYIFRKKIVDEVSGVTLFYKYSSCRL